MKLIRFRHAGSVDAGVLSGGTVIAFSEINARRGASVGPGLLELIDAGDLAPLSDLRGIPGIPLAEVTPLLPYPRPPKDLVHRPQLPLARRRHQRRATRGAGQFHETLLLPVRARRRDRAAPARRFRRRRRRGRIGPRHRPALSIRSRTARPRGDFRLHHNTGPHCARCPRQKPALPHQGQIDRHLLQLWPGYRDPR